MPPLHEALLAELNANNAFFDDLVDMIPAKLYVSGNTGDEAYNPKYHKGQHKESKEARRARNKESKLAKYDPNRAETTLQAKRRKADEDAETSSVEGDDDDDKNNDAMDIADDHEEEQDDDDGEAARVKKLEHSKKQDEDLFAGLDLTGLSRIEILRTKLRAKIAAKRAERPSGDDSQTVSKRAARRAEKRKKVEAAKQRNAAAGGHSDVGKRNGKGATGVVPRLTNDHDKAAAAKTKVATVKDDLAGIDFGGIAGLQKKAYHEDNRSLANLHKKKKSLDRLLQEAQDKQQRLQELKAGSDADKEKHKKLLWGDTLREATGERVQTNDPARIKQAMKRKANKKAKSAEAWKSRTDKTQGAMKERQSIRNSNLDRRKLGGATAANLSKKRIVEDPKSSSAEGGGDGKKKRRLGPHAEKSRAGFEGKKQGFINKGDSKSNQ